MKFNHLIAAICLSGVLISPAYAQTAAPVQPGSLTTMSCPGSITPCFVPYSDTNPLPVTTSATDPFDVNIDQVAGVDTKTGHGTAADTLRVELPTDGTGVVGLNAGSNIVGKVGIDQTTPGTTNGVVVNTSALPSGAATSALQSSVQSAAGTPNATALTVQGNASGVPLSVSVNQTTPLTTNGVNLLASPRASYQAVIVGYAAYATPTDMVCLAGSGTKTVMVTVFTTSIQSTAGALQNIYYIKRSTANSGGTPTTYTPIAFDSANAAATATLTSYAAAPTTGTTVGNYDVVQVVSSTLTAAGAQTQLATYAASPGSPISFAQPLLLRGTGEQLCINYNGAALTAGFAANVHVQWIEY